MAKGVIDAYMMTKQKKATEVISKREAACSLTCCRVCSFAARLALPANNCYMKSEVMSL